MSNEPFAFSYKAMGTAWAVSIWDQLSPENAEMIQKEIIKRTEDFEALFSRFRKTSVIWSLTEKRGVTEVPRDLVAMLRLYEKLNKLSKGKLNPLIGFAISDMGYGINYTLKPKEDIRKVPLFHDALRILDDTHIELKESCLIDLGALGKGYFVDLLAKYLDEQGMKHYLVNGSGDIRFKGNGEKLRVGLEHPGDASKVIGVIEMNDGCMCSSSGNRRKWDKYHHTIDPTSLTSPDEVIATWVIAESTATADGLCTCLFFCEPEQFQKDFRFEYCILNKDYKIKRSAGFTAELF